jgi:hypothetical protein
LPENTDEVALLSKLVEAEKLKDRRRVCHLGQLTVRLAVAAFFASSLFLHGADAENYPERRVTLIVPHPAGAQADAVARLLADRISKIWN